MLMLISLGVAIKIYWSYLRDIKQLNETNVVESLSKKLAILTRYVSQLNFYVLVFAPLGFAVGYTFALRQQEVDLTRVLVLLAFSLPFLGLIIWVCKKYIQVLYGRHLKRIEAIYQSLLEH